MSRRKLAMATGNDENAEIDLTPMLDVVFIMLIFFIVTASFLKESAIALNQPDSKPQQQQQDDVTSLMIIIDSANTVSINNRKVNMRAVESLVAQHLAEHPKAGVLIRAHEQSNTQTYTAVADQVRKSTRDKLLLTTYAD